jgi:two-component system sensor histidine kinase VanS
MTSSTPARRWLTFRARLTLAFTALVAIAGTLIVLVVTVFMRTVPQYETIAVEAVPGDDGVTSATPIGSEANPVDQTGITLRGAGEILNTSLVVSLIALGVIIAAGAFIAWHIAGRMIRPLHDVNEAAQLAGRGAFDHRLNLSGPRDEVRELADTFDQMLERLDRSFSASQRFAANASHELQTPLATSQTMLEVALADPDVGAGELRGVAERVLEMNRRSSETVSTLLDLAEIDERPIERHPVDLIPLLRSVLAEEAPAIEARRLTIEEYLPDEAVVNADGVLLRQAVSNLVRNAVRHNVDGGDIHLGIDAHDDALTLVIENAGAPLSEDVVVSLVEPFVRGAGRVSGASGHGLGLAIVESITRAHDGELSLHARPNGGLNVRLMLPTH